MKGDNHCNGILETAPLFNGINVFSKKRIKTVHCFYIFTYIDMFFHIINTSRRFCTRGTPKVSINPNTIYYIRYHRLLRCETHYFIINTLCNNVNDDNVHRIDMKHKVYK